jgi:hypothetical protein
VTSADVRLSVGFIPSMLKRTRRQPIDLAGYACR